MIKDLVLKLKSIKNILPAKFLRLSLIGGAIILVITLSGSFMILNRSHESNKGLIMENEKILKELLKLKSEDQYKINKDLEEKISNIEKTYSLAVTTYEEITDLRSQKKDTREYDELLAESLSLLSKRNYSSASALLASINTKLNQAGQKNSVANVATSTKINAPVNNTPPGTGYSRQNVKTDFGTFLVDIVTADLNSTRVIVDTATDGDCRDACPVLSLGDYAGRNGAFAGINGSYFCPADYPSCAGKTNSFDTLLMNKNKKYINSDNNVYSTVPAVIFSGSGARYVGQSLQWGRDTGVDSVLANQPLLVSGGKVVYGGDDEAKRAGAGSRSFVGSTGSTVYIGVVHGANAAQMTRVLHAMGIENALNLDSGGSTALWSGGYKVGPGRGIPNALLFVGK
ncbi:MAG: copper amine oxidase protein [uncultured bacterium]|nr:MAG: copper amine oxidase protein [uncultured bacterium]